MVEKERCACGLAVAQVLHILRESTRSAYVDMVKTQTYNYLLSLMSQLQVHISEAENSCALDLRPVREYASLMREALKEKDRRSFVASGMRLRENLTGTLEECVKPHKSKAYL